MALVAAGGVLGAAAREATEQALPTAHHGFPLATMLINLSGAFLLGVLLERLVRAGADTGWRRRARLLGGTGFMGAYTTYSTFAVEADLLVRSGRAGLAAAYVAATGAGGLFTVAAGIAVAARPGRGPSRSGRRSRRDAPAIAVQPAGFGLPVDPDVDREEGR